MSRYLSALVLSAVLSFALVWAWVVAMPMGFMDAEYPSWRAKEILLDRCDLGDVVILGDSRAAADILPERMPLRMTNLAVGGGEAIEARETMRDMGRAAERGADQALDAAGDALEVTSKAASGLLSWRPARARRRCFPGGSFLRRWPARGLRCWTCWASAHASSWKSPRW